MKKLVLFFAAVLLTAFSANVFAQSNTGTTPSPGSTFDYSVTDNSNDYSWSVTKGDLTTDAGTDAVLSATTGAAITITWASTVVVGDWYYVHVIETDANSCSNEKVLAVQITASAFYLVIDANLTDACYDGSVTVSLNGNTPEYSHGNATLTYTVSPYDFGSATGYSFDISETLPGTGTWSSVVSTSANASEASGTVTVTDTNPVTITFVVTNGNTYDNTSDAAGDAADFNQQVDISNGITINNGVVDNGNDGTYTDNTDVARPHTTTIGTN